MLEGVALAPLVSALIALVGVLVGLGIARFVLPGTRKIKRLEAEIEQLRREHGEYRGRVNSHFHKTAELIGNMTASYKAVYDHLSDGAQTLCAGDALSGPALFSGPRLILADNVEVTSAGVQSATSPVGVAPPTGSTSSAPVQAGTPAQRPDSAGADEGVSDDRSVSQASGVSSGKTTSASADAGEATGNAAPRSGVATA